MTALAYYNEIDPKSAAWLRELIKRGLIAPGDVDERSIEDVCPDDLAPYRQCHFFAGVGVWSYALRQAGWSDDREVWTGSCPCQPFSQAGKGGGFDDERHLWPAWFWLISQRRPGVIFGEQVASSNGLAWLDLVSVDLEGAGYAIGAADLCAAGFGAPHIRQRLFFVAHAAQQQRKWAGRGGTGGWLEHSDGGYTGVVADAERRTAERHGSELASAQGGAEGETRQWQRVWHDVGDGIITGVVADAAGDRSAGDAGVLGRVQEEGRHEGYVAEYGSADGWLADAQGRGTPATEQPGRLRGAEQGGTTGDMEYACGDECGEGWAGEETGNWPVEFTGSGATGKVAEWSNFARAAGTAVNGYWRGADWVWCNDPGGPRWRPIESGSFPLAHRLAARMVRLRGYGNAIVAPVATEFIRAYLGAIE